MVLASSVFAEGEQSEKDSSICYLVNQHTPYSQPHDDKGRMRHVACVVLPEV